MRGFARNLIVPGGAAGTGTGGGLTNIKVSAGTLSALRSDVTLGDSNGVSFGLNTNGVITGTVKTDYLTTQTVQTQNFIAAIVSGANGNGTFTSGTLSIKAGNNITLSSGANVFSVHGVAAQTVQTQNFVAVIVSGANGNGTFTSGTVSVKAGNNITLSTGANVFSIHAPSPTGGAVNFSAGTTSSDLASVVFSNSNGVSFGLNGGTITASVNAGGGAPNRSFVEIIDGERLTTAFRMTQTQFTKRPVFQPFWLDGQGMSCKTVRFLISADASSNTLSMNFTHGVGFYSLVNSTSLALVSSTTNAVSLTASSQWSGVRVLDVTGLSDFTMSEGRWVLAYYLSGSNNSSAVANFRIYGADNVPNFVGYISAGTDATSATHASSGLIPFWGVYSNTTAAFPANVGKSDMSMQSSGVLADMYAVIMQMS